MAKAKLKAAGMKLPLEIKSIKDTERDPRDLQDKCNARKKSSLQS